MFGEIPKEKKLILFDGVCNLCNSSVLLVIKNDKNNLFVFTPLQSDLGKEITSKLKINIAKVDSIIFLDDDQHYIKSTAALKIAKHFGGLWILLQVFWIFPEGFRNFFYDIIAKNRYTWFGKQEQCMIPTPELKSKFLE